MGRHLAAVAILLCPSFGAAQHPWVDLPFPFEAEDIGLILKAGGPNHDELPRDGVSSCPVVPWVKWRDPVAPSAWQGLLSLVCVDSPGPFAPDRVDVPLAAGRYEGASVWHQWPEPLGEDQTVALRVGTWGRQTDVPLTLRGVELVATREHDEPLYSGTATGRATCAVTVKAWCPTAPHLRPQGVVGAHVTADAVWLRTEEEGQPRWQEHLEEPLRLLRAADGQEFMGARFTLAADAPNMLPEQHYPYPTYLDLSLGDASGYVGTHLQFEVREPRKYVLTWDGTEVTTRVGKPFRGTLAVYADESGTQFYYGAKGELEWRLPQGTHRTPFHLSTTKAEPFRFESQRTTAAGHGTVVILEERGGPGGATKLLVKRR